MTNLAALTKFFLLLSLSLLTYGSSPSDYNITSLPFYNDTLPYEMYSGFLPINVVDASALSMDQQLDGNQEGALFFWLFKTKEIIYSDIEIPLLMWLNGGPGSSSLYGQFRQNGPLIMTQDPIDLTKPPSITFRDDSWLKVGHLLYIDSPIGTGLSYNNTVPLRDNVTQVAEDMYSVLVNFFQIFTDLRSAPFYLTGESFCGKYIPQMADTIITHNQQNLNYPIHLKAVILSNPLIHPQIQRPKISTLAKSVGLVTDRQYDQINLIGRKCAEAVHQTPALAYLYCNNITDYMTAVSGGVSSFDVRKFSTISEFSWEHYLNGDYTKDVIDTFHIKYSPKTPHYEHSSPLVKQALSPVYEDSSLSIVEKLLPQLPFLIYIGQFDGRDGVIGQEEIISIMNFPGKDSFEKTSPHFYYYPSEIRVGRKASKETNSPKERKLGAAHIEMRPPFANSVTSKKSQIQITQSNAGSETLSLGGYFRQVENFSFMIAHGAGHFVPKNQINMTISLLSDYIAYQHVILCRYSIGKSCRDAIYKQCDYLNNCNGNGACDQGQCYCYGNYFGADCSFYPTIIDSSMNLTFELPPQDYKYFSTLPGVSDDIMLTFETDNPDSYFSIYGVHNETLQKSRIGKFSFEFFDIQKYWHVHHEKPTNPTNNPDIIVVYNPTSAPIQFTAYHQYLTFDKTIEKDSSFWGPPNGGFVLILCVLIGGIVSAVFNCVLRCKIKKAKKNCYKMSEL